MNTYLNSYWWLKRAFLALILGTIFLPSLVFGQTVFTATVDGEITAGTVPYVERALKQAVENQADLFVLQINTPGGLLKSTETISRLLLEAPVQTLVFGHKDSGWVFSAGVFILLSGDQSALNSTAVIGAATPVDMDGGDLDNKTKNATGAWIQTLAERSDRDTELALQLVSEARTVSGAEALATGLVDYNAGDLNELLAALDMGGAVVTEVSPSWLDNTLSFLSLPYLIPLLLSLGFVGILLTFYSGSIETVGVSGVVLLLLGLWSMGDINITTLGISLFCVGLLLLAVEVFFSPGFGAAGLVGVLALLLSTVTFAYEPLFPSYFVSLVFYVILGFWLAVLLLFAWMAKLSMTAQLLPVAVGSEAMMGKEVVVTHDISSLGGRITFEGDSYLAKSLSGAEFAAGEKVVVVKVEGNTILVK